ncbi:MAG TPA: STAS domain-containing protein [Bryobacteraceae bacterium]|nr:STAS domain-containing protein [Bryobacteraceae bacterium]
MAAELQIQQHDNEGIRILELHGRLTIGDSEGALRADVVALADGGIVRIVLNFLHVAEMDDDGLGALVFCKAYLLKRGGSLKLMNLSPRHMNLIVLARLEAVFEVYKTEPDAVDSFFPDRQPKRYDILEFVREQEKEASGGAAGPVVQQSRRVDEIEPAQPGAAAPRCPPHGDS